MVYNSKTNNNKKATVGSVHLLIFLKRIHHFDAFEEEMCALICASDDVFTVPKMLKTAKVTKNHILDFCQCEIDGISPMEDVSFVNFLKDLKNFLEKEMRKKVNADFHAYQTIHKKLGGQENNRNDISMF